MKRYLVIFHFKLNDGTHLPLTYRIQNNSFSHRWIEHVKKRKLEQGTNFTIEIFNKNISHLPEIIEKLNSFVDYLNSLYDKKLPKLKENIDHDILNELHEEFEEYGARHLQAEKDATYNPSIDNIKDYAWYERAFNINFHETWLSLNTWIHFAENAMDSPEYSSRFNCIVNQYPNTRGENLQEIDKLFLTNEFEWGHIYLGYNTLGKDYMHTAEHNDTRVVLNDQVKVQEYFSTEVYLEYNSDKIFHSEKKGNEVKFYQWYINQSKEVQDLVPIDNLNKLCLGKYYLGRVSFDHTFLKYHSNPVDWDRNTFNIRHRWNMDVFSKISEITDIEITFEFI